MNTLEFLEAITLKARCFFLTFISSGKVTQKQFRSAKEAVEYITPIKDSSTLAIYFTAFTFEHGARRLAENAVETQYLWADIDCGEGKPYKNKKEGAKALAEFRKTGFPDPTLIVDSGGGLHAWWRISSVLPTAEWKPLAEKFKAFCRNNKFYIDPNVTADPARIMRLPGTMNNKFDPGKPCKVLGHNLANTTSVQKLNSLLAIRTVDQPPDHIKAATFTGTEELTAHVWEDKKYSMAEVVRSCPVMQEVHKTHGKSCSEPLWMHTLNIARFTEDGKDWIHPMSNGHPGYSEGATAKKFAERQDNIGPSLCSTLETETAGTGYSLCGSCEHKGHVKSPITLGALEETTPDPGGDVVLTPEGYAIRYGTICKKVTTEKGANYKKILPFTVEDVKLTDINAGDGKSDQFIEFNYVLDKVKHKVNIHHKCLKDTGSTFEATSEYRMSLNEVEAREFRILMNAWVTKLRREQKVAKANANFGWCDKYESFNIGDTIFHSNGEVDVHQRRVKYLTEYYLPKGDIAPWKTCSDFLVKQGRIELLVVLATAFAAPLMVFTGLSGAVISIVSTSSGTGKTTALKIGQAAWGDPIKGINALDDTPKSVTKKLGVLCNLPAYWDEVRGQESVSGLVTTLFQLSQGKERARLTSDVKLQEMGEWCTILACASNESLLEYAGQLTADSDAGIMRMMEFTVPDSYARGGSSHKLVSMFSELNKNYGHAGRIYAEWLVHNTKLVRDTIYNITKGVEKQLHTSTKERFWVATIAALLAGATFARTLGLVDFDVKKLKVFLYKVVMDMRSLHGVQQENADPVMLLRQFMYDHDATSLHTTVVYRQGTHLSKHIMAVRKPPLQSANASISYQYGTEDKWVRVPKKNFEEWCRGHKKNATKIIHDLYKRGVCLNNKARRRKIGSGTTFLVEGQIFCYEFDMTHAEEED